MPSNRFSSVQGNNPRRSAFDLSHQYLTACDMGQLVPVLFQECVAGDTFNLGQEVVLRMQPLVAPIMHEIDWTAHSFFVPTRLMMGRNAVKYNSENPTVNNVPTAEREWEDFIKGGDTGDEDITLPIWRAADTPAYRSLGSLFDFFGHQTDIPTGPGREDATPLSFDKRAYNLIWNEYYRDEELQDNVPLDSEDLLYRNWRKDYFTIARPEQQRGTSPSFPLSYSLTGINAFLASRITSDNQAIATPQPTASFSMLGVDQTGTVNGNLLVNSLLNTGNALTNVRDFFSDLFANAFDTATVGFDMNDLRTAVQIQRFMELNARAGTRYIEFLKAHFGVAPRDSTLQRPDYIGGCGGPVVISEVLQTSETLSSPQGNMAGHGITASRGFVGKYFCTEPGYIVTLLSIMPRPLYQQGIRRQSLRRSRYDFYFPEFAHLSEQAVYNAELCVPGEISKARQVFGYQPIYEEMRVNRNMVTGVMRDGLEHWHVSRIFSPTSPPALNDEFISTRDTIRKDIFAFYDMTPDAAGFIVNIGHYIKAIRPLPYFGTPGRLDHVGGV